MPGIATLSGYREFLLILVSFSAAFDLARCIFAKGALCRNATGYRTDFPDNGRDNV